MQTNFTAPLQLRAASPQSLATRLEGVAYTGGLVASMNIVIDLSSTRVDPRMPLLAEHERDKIIGVVERAAIEGRQIVVAGKLFSDLPGSTAQRIAELCARGMPYQMSVGLFGYTESYIPSGTVLTVNSATVTGPATVLRGGHVREVSIVALGADSDTTAKLFSGAGQGPRIDATALYKRLNAASGIWR